MFVLTRLSVFFGYFIKLMISVCLSFVCFTSYAAFLKGQFGGQKSLFKVNQRKLERNELLMLNCTSTLEIVLDENPRKNILRNKFLGGLSVRPIID